jgi:hypothetical protein
MIDRFITSGSGVSMAHFKRNNANAKRAILKNNSKARFMAISRDIYTFAADARSPKKS